MSHSATPATPTPLRNRWLTPIAASTLGVLAVGMASPSQRLVVAPLIALVLIALAFLATLRAGRTIPLDEVGTWYVPAVTAYGALPLIAFLLVGLQYTPLSDLRLYDQQPTPQDVGRIGWYHVCYLAAFAVVYVLRRRRARAPASVGIHVGRATATAAMALWLLCTIGVLALELGYNLNAETYQDSYLIVQQLPLVARQVLRFALGMRVVLSLVILAWIFSAYRRRRWMLFLWIVVIGSQTLLGGGARTPLVLLLAGSAILYHRVVRPFPAWKAYAGGTTLFVLFMGLGVIREFRGNATREAFTLGLNVGEFESVFANAVDLEQRKRFSEFNILSPTLYLSEIASAVPSEVLPFQKVDLSDWYLETFYPGIKAQGGGLAFGVVSQSIVGLGWLELIVRGAFVGFVFAWLHCAYKSRQTGVWPTVAYVWLIILAYQSFRNVTLYPVSMFIQQFIPTVILVEVARRGLVRAGAPQAEVVRRAEFGA